MKEANMSYYKVCPDCGAHLDSGEICDCQFTVNVTLRVGPVPYIGCTMTDDREKEIARTAALRNMHKFGLEPCEANLPEYFRRAREAMA
jgi:hypothetical protein